MREAGSQVEDNSDSTKRLILVAPFAKISLKSIVFWQRSPVVQGGMICMASESTNSPRIVVSSSS